MALIQERVLPEYRFHHAAAKLEDGSWNLPVNDEAALHVARERRRGERDDDVVARLLQ